MKSNPLLRYILGVLGLALLIWLAWQVMQVFVYFAISVVLALMGRPLIQLLSKVQFRGKHLPMWFSAACVLVTYLVGIVLFFKFLIPILAEQIDIIVNLDVESFVAEFDQPIYDIEQWFLSMNITGVDRASIQEQFMQYLDFSHITMVFEGLLSGIGSIFIGFLSILFITFFLLKDNRIVNNIVNAMTPDKHLTSIHNVLKHTKDLLTRYFIGMVIQISIITTIVSVGLTIFGVPNALLIGVLAGIINIIPYIGPLIGGTIGLILSVLSFVHLQMDGSLTVYVAKVLSVFATAQLTDNFVLQPLIFSKSVKAHPLEIFVVIMAAGMIAGVVGMVLAVPTYTFLRIVGKEFFQGYKVVQGLTKDL